MPRAMVGISAVWNISSLSLLPDIAIVSPVTGTHISAGFLSSVFITCLPVRVWARHPSPITINPFPCRPTSRYRADISKTNARTIFSSAPISAIIRTDSPNPRADGKSRAIRVNILPLDVNRLILSVDIAWNAVCNSSPSLNFKSSAFKSKCPLAARIQPIVDRIIVSGSFSINSSAFTTISSVASAHVVRRRPNVVFLSYVFLISANHAFI